MPSPFARRRTRSVSRAARTVSAALIATGACAGLAVASVAFAAGPAPSGAAPSSAAPGSDAEHRAVVVARVGTHVITTGDVEERIAAIPFFQLAQFGLTADEIRRKILNDVLVPDALYVVAAETRKLDKKLPTSQEVTRALSNATLRATRANVGAAAAISMADVKAYYDENRARYEQPERYSIWRILCKTRDEAAQVIAAAKKDSTTQAFTVLAREKSLDKATYLRSGNLGFLSSDGASNEAGLHVDPAVVKAATTVRDGELVPVPVAEGDAFAVVWRRGTVSATRKTLDDAASQIRDTLFRQRLEQSQKQLMVDLRAKNLTALNEALVNTIEIAPENGSVVPRKRPGQVPATPPPSSSAQK